MLLKFFNILLYYFIIIFSVIGYGRFFSNYLFHSFKNLNIGYHGILGLVLLLVYSYISNIFYSHNFFHNTILIILGLFLFFKTNNNFNYNFTFTVFSLLFISLIIFKTHDDFPYYHFAYSYYLTQSDLIVGLGNLNHGFRTPSSIFYLNSLFYLPNIKYYFFHLPAVLVLGYSNLILLDIIFESLNKKKIQFKPNYIFYFSILVILFINIFFYRISEHGTDRSAQILIFLFLIEFFVLIEFKEKYHIQISKIFVLLSLIITLKAFYFLYLIFTFPILFFLFQNFKFKKVLNLIFKDRVFYLFLTSIFFLILINFFNTGCFLYPVQITCFESVTWSIPKDEVLMMNNWYEQWSKAGAGPEFRVENPEIYIQKFNWIENWIEKYFFTKVSDFLFGIFILSTILYFSFYSKKNIKLKINNYLYFIYFIIILLFLEWLYNHPSLRYGGYVLISTIIFLPLSVLLSKFSQNKINFKKKIFILLVLVSVIFFARNINRIDDEVKKYSFKPFSNYEFRINENHFRIHLKITNLIHDYQNCDNSKRTCAKQNELKIINKNGKYVILR